MFQNNKIYEILYIRYHIKITFFFEEKQIVSLEYMYHEIKKKKNHRIQCFYIYTWNFQNIEKKEYEKKKTLH